MACPVFLREKGIGVGKKGRNKNRKMERLRGMGEQIREQARSICIVCMASIQTQRSLTHIQECIGL